MVNLKIARPNSSQNFKDTAKTNRFDSFVDTNNRCSSFSNHTHIKLIKKSKTKKPHVNSKPKVLSNTMFRIYIHRTTDRLGQKLGIKIVFPNQFTMFAGIL